jgi:hypothetical protein
MAKLLCAAAEGFVVRQGAGALRLAAPPSLAISFSKGRALRRAPIATVGRNET